MKKKEILRFAAIWMDIEDIMLSGKKPDTEGPMRRDSTSTRHRKQTHRSREQSDGRKGGVGEIGSCHLTYVKFQLGMMKTF